MADYILALDQGTTSTKAFLLDSAGGLTAGTPVPITQIYPAEGYVEHDPEEIYRSVLKEVSNVLRENPQAVGNIDSMGITNQRETTIAFGRNTLRPVMNAIVWQCRRTTEICSRPELTEAADTILSKTGLKLDPYFSATKIRWILEENPDIAEFVRNGDILFATVDGYLVYRLTGKKVFATDYSNAARTMLFNINSLDYDDMLLDLFGVPRVCLAEARPSCSDFGSLSFDPEDLKELGIDYDDIKYLMTLNGVRIKAVCGDQPSALFGQYAVHEGDVKTTYGTGCFTVMNVGTKPVISPNGLLTSPAWSINGETVYALEGSAFQGGSIISWLKDELKMIEKASDVDGLCTSIDDNGGVYLVPAFTGLGAPYWNPEARGVIVGLTRGSGRAHIVRAGVEAIAYQVAELVNLMMSDTGIAAKQMKVDGGACASDFLMQFQSDLLGIKITRARSDEMTAQGVGILAGLSSGFFASVKNAYVLYKAAKTYEPAASSYSMMKLIEGYQEAVRRAIK